jgi:hypothetical protein
MTIRTYLSKHSTSNLSLLLTGGAGVVSKDIDGKPFIDSLTRVMAEAYSYAKKGSKDSGKSVLTGTDVSTRNNLIISSWLRFLSSEVTDRIQT